MSARDPFWQPAQHFGLAFGLHVLGSALVFAETRGKRRSWTTETMSTASKLGESCPPDQMLIPFTAHVPSYVFPSDASTHVCI